MKKLIDRLYDTVEEKGHVCLGLDTDPAYIPKDFLQQYATPCDAVLAFNRAIIDATQDVAAVYKVQIAYYEALGLEGLRVYAKTLAELRKRGAIVIADIKRGDISKTAEMYAKAHFSGDFAADFITINPFMGMDTVEVFLPWIQSQDKGVFALVATSNPGASDIQGIVSSDGETLTEITGTLLQALGKQFVGQCEYSAIGAVVGCTNPAQSEALRHRLDSTFFLIPGYGAQGGGAEDTKAYLKNGNGGVVNSSRGILLAYQNPNYAGLDFAAAARAETIHMRDEIRRASQATIR